MEMCLRDRVYSSSLGQTMSLMSGPANYTWTAPLGDSETDSSEDNTVTACGLAVMQWEDLEKMAMDDGKTCLLYPSLGNRKA